MIKISVLSFFAFAIALGIHESRVSASEDVSRLSHFTCELDIAFASNDASSSFAFGKHLRAPTSEKHQVNLIGRGVASCKNDQGFHFNLPSVMAIALVSENEIPVGRLRATVEPVSVERDVNRIFDEYSPHAIMNNVPTTLPNAASEQASIVRGQKNDLLMQVNLTLPVEYKSKIKISQVDLKFDGDAPHIRSE